MGDNRNRNTSNDLDICLFMADLNIQPVPAKMRLEMGREMQVEILNGGKILVNCKFKPQS